MDSILAMWTRRPGRRPSRSITTAEYVRSRPDAWTLVDPGGPVQLPQPLVFGEPLVRYDLPSSLPEVGVLEIDSGSVYASHGWVLTPDDKLIADLSWYGGPHERLRLPANPRRTTFVRGRCLSLASEWASENYAHFILDSLGRMAIFAAAGGDINAVDSFYCAKPPSAEARRLFLLLHIPEEKIVWAESSVCVQADVMIVPSFPAHQLTYRAFLPTFLQELAGTTGTPIVPGRRLYVSRARVKRGVRNESEVRAVVEERGFDVYDPMSSANQAADFATAEIVVASHGAALANLAFCAPGASVVELVPLDNAYPFYYSLALAAGLDYRCVAGVPVSPSTGFGPSESDFDVDVAALRAALRPIPAGTAS
jgi:capsular polysaccharide biosynthesis protein